MGFLEHFGFIEQPFGVTPDPRFLHLGAKHREALACLLCATEENRGFVALIGPPGIGKTTLLFQYLENIRQSARTVFLFQNPRDTTDLMRYLLADLGLDVAARDLPEMNQALNQVLLEEMRAGRRVVLVIDEAQNLGIKVLESVRLLSNFETPWAKLIQIVLAGQPRLAEVLAQPSMAQLRQRISSFARLDPFTAEETNAYIDHRLWVAGCNAPGLFTVGARTLIAEHGGGIPRKISNLCYQSLVIAHAADRQQVKAEMVREVIADLAIESLAASRENGSGARRILTASSPKTLFPVKAAPAASSSGLATTKSSRFARVLAISSVLFLSIVSGVLWKVKLQPQPLGVTPSVEAAAFPALPTALAPAPETMFPSSMTYRESSGSPTGLTAGGTVASVVVEKGTTLRQISLRYRGSFGPRDLVAILALNPEIKDPDRLEAGEQIRIPASKSGPPRSRQEPR